MSTRGAWGFVLDGQEKIVYNHSDSYPDGLGMTLATWLVSVLREPDGLARLREQVRALAPVPDAEPDATVIARLAKFHDPSVGGSSGDSWYKLLRRTQGDPAATLEAGLFEDGSDFPTDSLFCEYAYVIDLDADESVGRFEVYEGFQMAPPERGRWAGHAPGREPVQPGATTYYPVELVASYPLPDVVAAGALVPVDDHCLMALASGASPAAIEALAESDS